MTLMIQDGSNAMDESLVAAVNALQTEIDKMSPNLKAIERCVLEPSLVTVLSR